LNVAVPLAPAASNCLAKPRSCFGGTAGADAGSVRYNCATSAPVTPPLLVMVAVTVATVSHRSAAPPGIVAPVAGPAVAVLVAVRPE
jgi:hypothetical protein